MEVPLIKFGKIGRGSGGGSLKEIVNCLAVDMLNLRYLWDIRWKDSIKNWKIGLDWQRV